MMALPILTIAGIVAEPDGAVPRQEDEHEGGGIPEPFHRPHPTSARSIRTGSPSTRQPSHTRRTPSGARSSSPRVALPTELLHPGPDHLRCHHGEHAHLLVRDRSHTKRARPARREGDPHVTSQGCYDGV